MPNKDTNSPKLRRLLLIIYCAVITLSIIFLTFNFFVRNDKIAYVDSGKILSEYKASEDAKKEYNSKAKVWQANIDTLTNEVKSAIQKYDKSVSSSSSKEQAMAKELIAAKQKQLSDYQHAIQANSREEDAKLTQKIVSQVNAFLLEYGKQHKYKLILIANSSGTIAYAEEGMDITDQVVKELNDQYIVKK